MEATSDYQYTNAKIEIKYCFLVKVITSLLMGGGVYPQLYFTVISFEPFSHLSKYNFYTVPK